MKTAIPTLLASATLLMGASTAAAVSPGTYKGETSQGKAISIKVVNAAGPGVRIERIKLSAELACPDGFPDEEKLDRLVIGGKVAKNGRFRVRMADLDISGRFLSKKRVRGSFDVSDVSCSADNIDYSARRK